MTRRNAYPTNTNRGASTHQIDPARKKLNELRAQLKAADPEARTSIRDELLKAMDDYFDADMKRRETELEEIKQRVDAMEQQLGKRAAAKDEIVALQVQMFAQEAEGLGFFGSSRTDAAGRSGATVYGGLPAGLPTLRPRSAR